MKFYIFNKKMLSKIILENGLRLEIILVMIGVVLTITDVK